jgi:hypothetical protein
MDNTSRILLRAAELIAERGWAQGGYEMEDGTLCALGAINYAAVGVPYYRRNAAGVAATQQLRRAVAQCPRWFYASIDQWNDDPGRTAEEVIDTLIAAAYWENDE